MLDLNIYWYFYFSYLNHFRCPELLYFSLKNDDIPDDEFSKAISKFEFLKGMAVNECLISHEILLHVYDCCIYFSELRVFAEALDEEMASIICDCLPCLHKLEIMDCTMSQQSILTLLDGLKELEYLDISGYENSGITGGVLEKASRLKVFKWASKYDEDEFEYCSDCEPDWYVDLWCLLLTVYGLICNEVKNSVIISYLFSCE